MTVVALDVHMRHRERKMNPDESVGVI
jgi:hypothetical protein